YTASPHSSLYRATPRTFFIASLSGIRIMNASSGTSLHWHWMLRSSVPPKAGSLMCRMAGWSAVVVGLVLIIFLPQRVLSYVAKVGLLYLAYTSCRQFGFGQNVYLT